MRTLTQSGLPTMFSRHLAVRSARNARALRTSQALAARADRPKDTKGLKPKILDDKPPADEDLAEDAKKHNEELSHRAEQAHEKLDGGKQDKTHKGMFNGGLSHQATFLLVVGYIG
jgi:hypothetical protein